MVRVVVEVIREYEEPTIMKFYYYTRWEFVSYEPDIGIGPFHSTWISESDPKEFLMNTKTDNLKALLFIIFQSKEEMEQYGKSVGI